MSLAAGARLGPYEIIAPLGAGGMGEVYKARDTRLDRIVAVKVLSDTLTGDMQFRERFDREARTISQLAHAHICHLYDVGEHEASAFLVLEYLEGETLAARIEALKARGKTLPLDAALTIAIEVAEGLGAAHASGVVHRDLKPANVMLTGSGAKLLDFGLAKSARIGGIAGVASPAIPLADLSAPMTMTSPLTTQGAIVGTVQYMAPEQLEGKDADARSDVFAFGAIVYEMVTATRAFQGKTLVSVMASILEYEPRLPLAGDGAVPASLARVVEKCLAKDPVRRWQSVADLVDALRWVAEESRTARESATAAIATTAGTGTRIRSRSAWALGAGSLVAGIALAAATMWIVARLQPVRAPLPVRFTIVPPAAQALGLTGVSREIAIAPDGTTIAYRFGTTPAGLAVRALGELEPRVLTGIGGVRNPVFSPDGHWLAFFAGGDLRKVAIDGGPVITLCTLGAAARGATWGDDDTIVFATNDLGSGLLSVSGSGGTPKVLTKPDTTRGEVDHVFPASLPGSKAILFTVNSQEGSENSQVAVVDRQTGRQKILVRGGSQPEYLDPGYLVYAVGGTLRAVRFDLSRLEVVGEPMPVADHVAMGPNGAADFALSRNGTLVLAPGSGSGDLAHSLVWLNRRGREEPIKAPVRAYTTLRLSPDGTRAALDIRDQERDIWVWDFGRETMMRLTFGAALEASPVWTPDGRRIAFQSGRDNGNLNIFWQASDGTGRVERLTKSTNPQVPTAFSPDGSRLVFNETQPKTGIDVRMLMIASLAAVKSGDLPIETIVQTNFQEGNADISPDGNWLAYQSNDSGGVEVYVRPFPKTDSGRWQISTAGGTRPVWSRDGHELFYLDPSSRLMVASIRTTPSFSAGNPVKLSDERYLTNISGRTFDVSPDGQRLLIIKDAASVAQGPTAPASLVVVEHWVEEVKARIK